MEHLLDNPVFNALCSGDAALGNGSSTAKFFPEDVSPFAGFDKNAASGFDDLYNLLPGDRKILYAAPEQIETPKGWKLLIQIPGLQFVLNSYTPGIESRSEIIPLSKINVEEMISLTALTRPGPFNKRTIEFGHYFGIFQKNQLAAMIGQRLHVSNYTELSAVCTHPDYWGKGFAGDLIHHQIMLILKMGQIPFLHVRSDNWRAIDLYERIGFKVSRPMNFYFLQKNKLI